jgi:hypothetical protein
MTKEILKNQRVNEKLNSELWINDRKIEQWQQYKTRWLLRSTRKHYKMKMRNSSNYCISAVF